MRSVKIDAPAKVNLFLEVAGKRKDGYHDLVTLFAKVTLSDELFLKRSSRPGIRLRVVNRSNLVLSAAGDNIVYKAAEKFFAAFGKKPAADMRLVKRVPVGAGLGGGSSDAAAALKGLCGLYGVSAPRNMKKLRAIALELGSDVPFFLEDAVFAAGTGRGEILRPVRVKGRLPAVLLVFPGVPVYTGPVYRALRPVPPAEKAANLLRFRKFLRSLASGLPPGAWPEYLFNRLEDPVLPRHAEVRKAKRDLEKAGARAVLMSGSGATVFALARDRAEAAVIAKAVKKPGRKIFLSNFC